MKNNIIESKLSEIGEFLLKYKCISNIALYGGDSGIVLFLALYYKYSGDERYFQKMQECIEEILETINNANYLHYSFAVGLAGWGWLLEYLNQHELVDIDRDSFLEDIDRYLEIQLDVCIEKENNDQLHGAIGIANYFLKRGIDIPVVKLLNRLNAKKEEENGEYRWSEFHSLKAGKFYDFGLAHGMAGKLYFFRKCYEKGICVAECAENIFGVNKFFLNNIQQNVGSYFPPSIPVESYQSKLEKHCRLAWCYGDPGVLYSLYRAANTVGNNELEELVIRMLENVSLRTTYEQTQIVDAGFCHGTAGVAHIYNRLYHHTKNDKFYQTASFWNNKSIEYSSKASENCGFQFYDPENGWLNSKGVLTGISGVGLTFISFLSPSISDWDECLLLS